MDLFEHIHPALMEQATQFLLERRKKDVEYKTADEQFQNILMQVKQSLQSMIQSFGCI